MQDNGRTELNAYRIGWVSGYFNAPEITLVMSLNIRTG